MKRFIYSLLCLVLLIAHAHADYLLNSYRTVTSAAVRPTLISQQSSFSTVNQGSRNVSLTIPVGTTLFIAYVSMISNENVDTSQTTLGGTNISSLTSTAQFGSRLTDFMVYRLNPTSGSTTLSIGVFNGDFQTSFAHAWYFSGTHSSDPIGFVSTSNSTSAQSRTINATNEYHLPYYVSGSSSKRNSGTGNCYTGTNLTVAFQDQDSTNTAATAENATVTGANTVPLTLRCSWVSGLITMDVVEVKGP